MNYMDEYNKWLNSPVADDETKKELLAIKDNEGEIKERFYQNLEFGTAGLRGIIAAGSNRMNKYVVRRATQGLADYISSGGEQLKNRGIAISYDSRIKSDEFAMETALVLCANGIKTYLFESLRPVPELSFTVRHLKTIAGIVITASHNPSAYNGFKAYWEDGAQIPPSVSDKVLEHINNVDVFDAKTMNENDAINSGLLHMIGSEADEAYIEAVYKQAVNKDAVKRVADKFKLVYTPIHGSGYRPVLAILEKSGFKNILLVKEQLEPDGLFPTVKAPNPEEKDCFDLAIKLAKENDVDLIIGTDPDADRVGIVVKNKQGDYVTLTGNQVGAMLVYYLLKSKKEKGTLPDNAAVISTIVSTKMTKVIADYFGVEYFETLTGFKFIGEKIKEFEQSGLYSFQFGFEESYGYLAGTHARDKDAVVASMLIAEMAAKYYEEGLTLFEAMDKLYEKFGGFVEETVSITMEGSEGLSEIQAIMDGLRKNLPKAFGEYNVTALRDYRDNVRYDLASGSQTSLDMPKSDVLYFEIENDITFIARPSGTEPKIKLYYIVKGDNIADAKEKYNGIKQAVSEFIGK